MITDAGETNTKMETSEVSASVQIIKHKYPKFNINSQKRNCAENEIRDFRRCPNRR